MQVATTQFLKYAKLAYQSASSCDMKDRIVWNTFQTLLEPTLRRRGKDDVLYQLGVRYKNCLAILDDPYTRIFPRENGKRTLFMHQIDWIKKDPLHDYVECRMPHPFHDSNTHNIRVYDRNDIEPYKDVPEEHREWFPQYVSRLSKNHAEAFATIDGAHYKLSPDVLNILRIHSIYVLHIEHITQ